MCNEYRFNAARDAIAAEFSKLQIPIRFTDAASNRPLGEPIKPTNRATIIRPDNPFDPGAGLHVSDIRWWLVPFFHRKAVKDWRAMCTNARFETAETNPRAVANITLEQGMDWLNLDGPGKAASPPACRFLPNERESARPT